MHGTLFEFLGVAAPSYFVLIAVGYLFAVGISATWAKHIGQDPDVIIDLGLMMVITGIVGARLLHVFADGYFWDYVHQCTDPSLVEWHTSREICLSRPDPTSAFSGLPESVSSWLNEAPQNVWDEAKGVCRPTQADCFAWARFWSGGLTFYGGLIASTLAAWFLFRRDRFPWWKGVDIAAMAIPLGQGFGRLGCLFAGCCFGKQADSPIALTFPSYSPASEWQARSGVLAGPELPSLPVHPTQLYEAVGAFLIAGLCIFFIQPRKRYDGQVFAVYLGGYSAVRFVLELFRSDDRGGLAGLSTSQIVGLCLIASAVAIHLRRRASGRVALPPGSLPPGSPPPRTPPAPVSAVVSP